MPVAFVGISYERTTAPTTDEAHQQIYRKPIELEQQNQIEAQLIHQEHRPDKKIYTLTSQGGESLRTWIETPSTVSPLKDELLVKIFAGSIV